MDALWKKVVDIKYDSMRGGWCSKEVEGPYGVGVWKRIRRKWDSFADHVRYEVGDGSKELFWHDVRRGEQPLKVLFSELFTIVERMRGWQRICNSIMETFIGILYLLDLYMIGR